jgi:spermidine synthase
MKLFQSWRIRKAEEDNESVYIREKNGVRSLHIGSDTIQSAMRIDSPIDLEVAYTRSMMAFLLFNPDPHHALLIGLGGGSLAKFFYHRLSRTRTLAVEINPSVIAVARQFFHLPPDGERFRVVTGDGADYLNNVQRRFDVIMLDGYDAEAQVEELSTLSFYRDCARGLGERGVLVVNLWGGDRNFTTCVQRLSRAFDNRVICMPAGKPGNVVALAFACSPGRPRWHELQTRAQGLELTFGLEFIQFVRELAAMNPSDPDGLSI